MPASGRHNGFVVRLFRTWSNLSDGTFVAFAILFFRNYRDLVKKSKPFKCASNLVGKPPWVGGTLRNLIANNNFLYAITSDTVRTSASCKYYKRDIRLNL